MDQGSSLAEPTQSVTDNGVPSFRPRLRRGQHVLAGRIESVQSTGRDSILDDSSRLVSIQHSHVSLGSNLPSSKLRQGWVCLHAIQRGYSQDSLDLCHAFRPTLPVLQNAMVLPDESVRIISPAHQYSVTVSLFLTSRLEVQNLMQ